MFIGNSPEEAKAQVGKLIFLADHWAYNDAELVRLLTTVFDWREANKAEREALLIGGGIYLFLNLVLGVSFIFIRYSRGRLYDSEGQQNGIRAQAAYNYAHFK